METFNSVRAQILSKLIRYEGVIGTIFKYAPKILVDLASIFVLLAMNALYVYNNHLGREFSIVPIELTLMRGIMQMVFGLIVHVIEFCCNATDNSNPVPNFRLALELLLCGIGFAAMTHLVVRAVMSMVIPVNVVVVLTMLSPFFTVVLEYLVLKIKQMYSVKVCAVVVLLAGVTTVVFNKDLMVVVGIEMNEEIGNGSEWGSGECVIFAVLAVIMSAFCGASANILTKETEKDVSKGQLNIAIGIGAIFVAIIDTLISINFESQPGNRLINGDIFQIESRTWYGFLVINAVGIMGNFCQILSNLMSSPSITSSFRGSQTIMNLGIEWCKTGAVPNVFQVLGAIIVIGGLVLVSAGEVLVAKMKEMKCRGREDVNSNVRSKDGNVAFVCMCSPEVHIQIA